MTESTSDPNFMTSLARGLSVLEAFATLGPDQTVAGLARHTGLARGVVARCLHTLVVTGYIDRNDRLFSVRPSVLRLADAYLSDRSLSGLAQPLLEALRDEIGESCSMGVLDGADVLYVARASHSRIMRIGLHVGSRLPAWNTSMGRVLLAGLPVADRNRLIPPDPLPRRTTSSISSREALDRVLELVERDGFALIDQELELGLVSIAVPVMSRDGRVLAALNVGANASSRTPQDLLDTVLPKLRTAAATLSGELHRR
ncbi:transcriptional regulator [Novosphingobium sp. Rr 2-17]|uniref:IclR family transcriptional regulator domain-containing protein n=1 Tax=Novosphingobium sp. Rr 2-17 TaxID=555793 RepID=UPI0002697EDE|nr:IclR family transcriptional regulator C-terminal domain-containing protein [Novosphingobium sp. Rr 2-17]EIZ78355.1 transcriptional regulator [Novosphingobium sp. Rr 2-17]